MSVATMTAHQTQPTMGQNERFFRYFQLEAIALQEQMGRLADTALVGGERADAIDHCLAGIARLSKEVKDASSYLPAYDQRTYAEAIKALSEKLNETRAVHAPKPKFTFKTVHKNPSAISLNDAAELASAQRRHVPGYRSDPSSIESSIAATPNKISSPPNEPSNQTANGTDKNAENDLLKPQTAAIRKPSFSNSNSVSITGHNSLHIVLPLSASHATSPGSLTSLKRCVVDLSVPTGSGKPLAGLTLKNIKESLIVCGHVNGPVHVTGVEKSVIVASCRQLRMHDCHGCDVYVQCASRPIIEDCDGVLFAPLPKANVIDSERPDKDHWNQVDDFKWLRSEHSPHWDTLPSERQVDDHVWKDVVPGGPGSSLDDILKATNVVKA